MITYAISKYESFDESNALMTDISAIKSNYSEKTYDDIEQRFLRTFANNTVAVFINKLKANTL